MRKAWLSRVFVELGVGSLFHGREIPVQTVGRKRNIQPGPTAKALNRTRDLENYELWLGDNWQLTTTTEHHNRLRILRASDSCGMRRSVVVSLGYSPVIHPRPINSERPPITRIRDLQPLLITTVQFDRPYLLWRTPPQDSRPR